MVIFYAVHGRQRVALGQETDCSLTQPTEHGDRGSESSQFFLPDQVKPTGFFKSFLSTSFVNKSSAKQDGLRTNLDGVVADWGATPVGSPHTWLWCVR